MFLVRTIKKKLQGLQSENTTVGHFYCGAAVYGHGSEIITDSETRGQHRELPSVGSLGMPT